MKLKGFEYYDEKAVEWKPLKKEIMGVPMKTCTEDMFLAFLEGFAGSIYIRKKEQP